MALITQISFLFSDNVDDDDDDRAIIYIFGGFFLKLSLNLKDIQGLK